MKQQLLKLSGLVVLVMGGFFLMQHQPDEDVITLAPLEEELILEEENESKENKLIMVDIKGEVAKPGVYELDVNQRVQDAIHLAGGLTSEANDLGVNLSQKLQDEMVIHIPSKEESIHLPTSEQSPLISLSKASSQELQSLPNIGESKANAIISYREEHGPFKTVEEVTNVAGIGEKTLEGFIDLVSP